MTDNWIPKGDGGGFDDFYLKVNEAWFGPNEESEYNPTRLNLNLAGEAMNEDGDVFMDETVQRWALRDGWEAKKGGKEAVHPTHIEPPKGTSFGHFVEVIAGIPNPLRDAHLAKLGYSVEDGFLDMMKDRGSPLVADTWNGLVLHLVRAKVAVIKNRDEGTTNDWNVLVPVAITEETKKAKAPKKKAAPATDKALLKAVQKFAGGFDDHATFVASVLDPDEFDQAGELDEDSDLYEQILDADSDLWTKYGNG